MKYELKATKDGKISFDFIRDKISLKVCGGFCTSDSGVNSCLWLKGIQGTEH